MMYKYLHVVSRYLWSGEAYTAKSLDVICNSCDTFLSVVWFPVSEAIAQSCCLSIRYYWTMCTLH